MDDYESPKHTKWEGKYHVVFIPEHRRKVLYQQLRQELGPVFRQVAQQGERQILAGHLVVDHVHMLISIPPRYPVAGVIGFIKGKIAIYLARTFGGRQRNLTRPHFWARGYFASTVGRDEKVIREYIRPQEEDYRRVDQMQRFD